MKHHIDFYKFSLLIISIIIVVKQITQYNKKHDQYQTLYSNPFNNLQFKNNYFDLTNFNYEGKCGEVFKHPPNNETDLILYYMSFSSEKQWLRIKDDTLSIFEMSYNVMKNCKRILILTSDPPNNEFVDEMKRCGIEIFRPDYDYPSGESVVERLFVEKIFLERNRDKFRRVVIADFRDIIFFNDVFATFSDNELVLTMQCRALNEKHSCDTLEEEWNYEWMETAFDKEIAEQMKKTNGVVVNGGLFLGGIDNIIGLLDVQTSNIRVEKYSYWGVDQAVLNYVHMLGKLDHLNLARDYCTQRVCYSEQWTGKYNRNKKSVITTTTGCSPVVRHKLQLSNPFFDLPHRKSLTIVNLCRHLIKNKISGIFKRK